MNVHTRETEVEIIHIMSNPVCLHIHMFAKLHVTCLSVQYKVFLSCSSLSIRIGCHFHISFAFFVHYQFSFPFFLPFLHFHIHPLLAHFALS